MSRIAYQFEGPFDSSYSLAILNREMARAVEALRPHSVALYSTEGPGDYAPDEQWLADDSQTLALWQRSEDIIEVDVTLRLLYPPRVEAMRGKLHVMNTYGWEESVFPAEHVAAFNQHLHLVTVMSQFVRKTLIDSGVTVPVVPVGVGVDHILRYAPEPVELPESDAFCFLHISSCFPRKGIDILLDSYSKAFSAQDNVLLIIKTFPNPHNDVEEQLARLRETRPDCPAIHLINEDLSIGQINTLYQRADALVAPSRGEGFGMPMAEAMLWDVPVITTGYGGHTDFCTPATAWLIDYQFAKAATHMQQFDSLWVEPDGLHLLSLMRQLFQQSQTLAGRELLLQRTQAARRAIEQGWCWQHVAQRLLNAVDQVQQGQLLPPKPADIKVAWITTWNTRCGIASYSEFLLEHLDVPVTVFANSDSMLTAEDGDNVIRCWETCGGKPVLDELTQQLLQGGYTAVTIQFNFAFFTMQGLGELLATLHAHGIATYLFFHSTQDIIEADGQLLNSIRRMGSVLHDCQRLFVHGVHDVDRLRRFGFSDNVSLIPHGVLYQPQIINQPQKNAGELHIGGYGFLLPGKGIPELIGAFALLKQRLASLPQAENLPHIRLELFNALYPGDVSRREQQQCETLIAFSGYAADIRLHTEYQDNLDSLRALSRCDLVVFPYQRTRESSSAAVRMGLASGQPVLCAPLGIFSDVEEIVHFLPGITPEQIAEGMLELLLDEHKRLALQQRQQQWLQSHDWVQVAKRLQAMLLQSKGMELC